MVSVEYTYEGEELLCKKRILHGGGKLDTADSCPRCRRLTVY